MYKVSIIGGGTGSFTLLNGLKSYPDLSLRAIVAMTDDGGSTGILRDELGALPPGDIRQCLVALSTADDKTWRDLFNLRFEDEGRFRGQNFGNILLTALEKISPDYETALEKAGKILQVKKDSKVIPITLDRIRLAAETVDNKIIKGEHNIDLKEYRIKRIFFEPEPNPNPKAIESMLESDLIVVAPGDIYTSILPNLIVKNIDRVFRDSKATKVYVCNIMTQKNHTNDFKVIGFVDLLEKTLGKDAFDFVIYNNKMPSDEFLKSYSQEGEYPVKFEAGDFNDRKTIFLGEDIISQKIPKKSGADMLSRALIRHDSIQLASMLYNLLGKKG